MTLSVRRVRDAQSLVAIEPAWTALWDELPDATPFQHPAWLIAWWTRLPKGTLDVFAVHAGQRLVAVLPLCRLEDGDGCVLRPLGFDISDYAEPLIAPTANDVRKALLRALAETGGWRRCELVVRDRTFWSGSVAPGVALQAEEVEPAPVLDLDPGFPDCLGAGIRHSLAESERRLAKLTPPEFESATPETTTAILDILFDLHARRWRRRGEGGVLGHPAVQAFHRDAASRLAAAGLLRLTLLRIGGRPAGVFYGFAGPRTAFYYIGGFDPAFRAVSPGSLLIAHAIRLAIERGQRAFDFLKGRERYKYRWGAVDRPRTAVTLVPAGGEARG